MDLSTLASLRVLEASPELNRVLSYEGVITYIDLIRILKPDLNCWQPPHQEGPPEHLPLATHDFLKLCLNLEDELAKLAWHALRQIAWNAGVEGGRYPSNLCPPEVSPSFFKARALPWNW